MLNDSNMPRPDALAPELDDIDPSEPEGDDEFEDVADEEDDTLPGSDDFEAVVPTPTHAVARMHLNTLNRRTGGFAWFSA